MKDNAGYSQSLFYYSDIIPHPELDLWELSVYKNLIRKTDLCLIDLGCGEGDFLCQAKNHFNKVIGIDLNNAAINTCTRKGVTAYKQNAVKTSFNGNTFDIVRAQNILEHLKTPEKLVIESHRILKPSGYLVIHVPTQFSTLYPITNFWDDYTHVRPFTKRGITRLLNDFGYKIIFIKGYTVGRNFLETILCKIIGIFLPFCWFVIAVKK